MKKGLDVNIKDDKLVELLGQIISSDLETRNSADKCLRGGLSRRLPTATSSTGTMTNAASGTPAP